MSIFIVAEIGINHNGQIDICKQLIDVAKVVIVMQLNFKRDIDLVYSKEFLRKL